MSDTKVIFIAFAKEDEASRNLFSGQRLHTGTPFSFTDMGVKQAYSKEWKEKVRTRVRRSDGVIALISRNTPKASGELWEISCAIAEKKPVLGIWLDKDYRVKPSATGTAPCKVWTWDNVAKFIARL
jgi:nucleoside 2-deoxyribosyltransferase